MEAQACSRSRWEHSSRTWRPCACRSSSRCHPLAHPRRRLPQTRSSFPCLNKLVTGRGVPAQIKVYALYPRKIAINTTPSANAAKMIACVRISPAASGLRPVASAALAAPLEARRQNRPPSAACLRRSPPSRPHDQSAPHEAGTLQSAPPSAKAPHPSDSMGSARPHLRPPVAC